MDGLDGAASVVVSPDNQHIYVAGQNDDAVAALSRVEFRFLDFSTLPSFLVTNIDTYFVSGSSEVGSRVSINGQDILTDNGGNFAELVPLVPGDNTVELVIEPPAGSPVAFTKTIRYDPTFSTAAHRLLYVDSVAVSPVAGEAHVPSLSGAAVIDLDQGLFLGVLPDRHVQGISPGGDEIYMEDRSVFSTALHVELVNRGPLAFTRDIPGNAFLASPDGLFLYSEKETLDLAANEIVETFGTSITTGISFSPSGAPVPGGPEISADGQVIFCCTTETSIIRIFIVDSSVELVETDPDRAWQSDLTLSLDESLLTKIAYAGQSTFVVAFLDGTSLDRMASTSVPGDFSGEAVFSPDGNRIVVGSAGNPLFANGGLSVLDTYSFRLLFQLPVNLADNLSRDQGEIFASSGKRLGVDSFILGRTGRLLRTASYFLGINRFIKDSGSPKHDQIRKIVVKPVSSAVNQVSGTPLRGPRGRGKP